jgi:hypothetical protein
MRLLENTRAWQLLPNGTIRHEKTGIILRLIAGGWLGSFSESSQISLPLSLWEMAALGTKVNNVIRDLVAIYFGASEEESLISAICESMMTNPDELDVGSESIAHRSSGLEFDFGMGLLFIRCGLSSRLSFNIHMLEKLLLSRAIRRCVRQTFVNKLKYIESNN